MKIIVIGGSAGSLEALKEITAKLPANFPGSVFIVMHMPSKGHSMLDKILNFKGTIKSKFAEENETIEPGQVYLAPIDFHLVLEKGKMRLTLGPKENWFRPAVNVLFRSAAASYGQEVVAVVLSGNLYDGTAGLLAVKDRGGLAIVQDPEDAIFPSMPSSALKNVEVNYCVPASGIADLLQKIVMAHGMSLY